MQISSYPACCGAAIITGFGISPTQKTPRASVYDYDLRKYVTKSITYREKLQNLIKQYQSPYQSGRMIEAILNKSQVDLGWVPVLKAVGFEFVTHFQNSVHASDLWVFQLVTGTLGRTDTAPKGWDTVDVEAIKKQWEEEDAKAKAEAEKLEADRLKSPFPAKKTAAAGALFGPGDFDIY